jgi:flagellin
MGMRINTNVEAFNAQRNLQNTSVSYAKSVEKLSSGLRINRAGDDAAGLSISEKLRAQTRGLGQAQRNAQDGISLIQTGEGALNETHSILQRMNELAVEASNGTLSTDDQTAVAGELEQLKGAVNDIASQTQFNGTKLLNATGTVTFQVGANNGETLAVSLKAMDAGNIGAVSGGAANLGAAIDAFNTSHSAADAQKLIDNIAKAVTDVSAQRATFGASQNRLEHTIANLGVAQENTMSAESRIRDVDMASEMVNFTKTGILQQAGQAILAQANQSGQGVLSLLRG